MRARAHTHTCTHVYTNKQMHTHVFIEIPSSMNLEDEVRVSFGDEISLRGMRYKALKM